MLRLLAALLLALQICPAKPKLVVLIVIDQFPNTYMQRFRSQYHGGLDRMLREGAVFTNARYHQAPTVTAVGHSIIGTGAMPAVSGIVGNVWYDRDTHTSVTSVCDAQEKQVGGAVWTVNPQRCEDTDPASPRRLLASTVGDELKMASRDSHVVGISFKARSAILPAGHMADGAYWFDSRSGNFISSTFYFPESKLPAWAEQFNARRLADRYVDQAWTNFPKWKFQGKANKYDQLMASPWGNELIEKMAEAAVAGEQLGRHAGTDLLSVSFSSNDAIGHQLGPDAPEVEDMARRVDVLIGALLSRLEAAVGPRNLTVVLTADHGVAPVPAFNIARRMPAGSLKAKPGDFIQMALAQRFGEGQWIENASEGHYYFNQKLIAQKKLDRAEVERTAADALLDSDAIHPFRVYTRTQLLNGWGGDFIGESMRNGFYARRSADLFLLLEPGWLPAMGPETLTSHSTPFSYDTHVPVIFWGQGIRRGRFHQEIAINDIAPTLTTLLDIGRPSGASGRALAEIFTEN
jgi:predicted AlkP superfamily pyrophosphatase or phosphodiesterase